MIDRAHSRVSVHRQCVLLSVPRSTIYYRAHPRPVDDRLLRAITVSTRPFRSWAGGRSIGC